MNNFKFTEGFETQRVWCPTTETETWIAYDPDTKQEFITGNSKPNITQIPKTEEFRKLLTVPRGKVLIDIDADALELVMLGHYLGPYDNYFYAQTVDSGDKALKTDIHSVNQRATNLPTRDEAKTFIYGLTYFL
jgi:hypothetical protein